MTNTPQDPDIAVSRCPQCGANVPPFNDAATCQYCGTNLVRVQSRGHDGQLRETVVGGVRLKPYTLSDPQAGMDVLQMLVPVGWEAKGTVTWDLQNVGMPATVALQVWNPSGAEAFEVFPNINFTSGGGGLGGLLSGLGGKSYGAEVRQPLGAQQMLRDIMLPRYRGQVGRYSIVAEDPLPDLPRQIARSQGRKDDAGGQSEGAHARIRYSVSGRELEEEVFGCVEVFRVPSASMFGQTQSVFWWADYLFSFRADAGQLDGKAGLFQAMTQALRVNPRWRATVEQMTQSLAQGQIQRIHSLGQFGQAYAQQGAQMREENLQDWYRRGAVEDRLSREWSETIREVETYRDPFDGREVELPNTYQYAWTTPLGEVIMTDDPNLNPNVGDNRTWEPMTVSH